MEERIRSLEAENDALRAELRRLQQQKHSPVSASVVDSPGSASASTKVSSLDAEQVRRYSRQLILPEVRLQGQLALANTSVLVVGAGGIGCPAAMYLVAAGTLGILDHDAVDLGNLHRQILHAEASVGLPKAESAAASLRRLNSRVRVVAHHLQLASSNAADVFRPYDIICDASDNVPTRYLVNDTCVALNKPLVSASALRLEGQLSVYNYHGGPCYRCLFPLPPPPETVGNCSDNGVLGPVAGLMGCAQALEAIKIAIGSPKDSVFSGRLMLYDGAGSTRVVKLRPRDPACRACGKDAKLDVGKFDYPLWCGAAATDAPCARLPHIAPEHAISCEELRRAMAVSSPLVAAKKEAQSLEATAANEASRLLLDVRPRVHFEICSLEPSVNVPLRDLESGIDALRPVLARYEEVYVLCRRGVDSVAATKLLLERGLHARNVTGGLEAWRQHVDPKFPLY